MQNLTDLIYYPTGNPGAVDLISKNKEFIKDETIAWISHRLPRHRNLVYFTYNEAKCERDTGIIIDGIIHDLKYNGNAKTYLNAGRYYEGTQSLINGPRTANSGGSNPNKNYYRLHFNTGTIHCITECYYTVHR